MKKDDVVREIDEAGFKINDLYARAWNTALHPTEYGWAPSVASVVAIPVLSFASLGQLVSSAVVKQVSPGVFDALSNLGGKPKDEGDTR